MSEYIPRKPFRSNLYEVWWFSFAISFLFAFFSIFVANVLLHMILITPENMETFSFSNVVKLSLVIFFVIMLVASFVTIAYVYHLRNKDYGEEMSEIEEVYNMVVDDIFKYSKKFKRNDNYKEELVKLHLKKINSNEELSHDLSIVAMEYISVIEEFPKVIARNQLMAYLTRISVRSTPRYPNYIVENLLMHQEFDERFLKKQDDLTEYDWSLISEHQELTDDFIRKNKDILDLKMLETKGGERRLCERLKRTPRGEDKEHWFEDLGRIIDLGMGDSTTYTVTRSPFEYRKMKRNSLKYRYVHSHTTKLKEKPLKIALLSGVPMHKRAELKRNGHTVVRRVDPGVDLIVSSHPLKPKDKEVADYFEIKNVTEKEFRKMFA